MMSFAMGNELQLESRILIDRERLDENQYTLSLLQEGINAGVFSSTEVSNVQINIMELLKELIMRYTKGESTSVTVDTTERLLSSILYSIDFYLLGFDDTNEALINLKEKSIRKIYEQGLEQLRLCLADTKDLYLKIRKTRLKLDIEAYNATIDEAIPVFFEKYNIVFDAHMTMATIDYPLVFDDMRVRGITYIKNYLRNLEAETQYCRLFSDQDINKLLQSFGRMCRLNHRIELINIFELLLNNSIFSVMCGNSAKQLSITKEKLNALAENLRRTDSKSLKKLIDDAVAAIIDDFQIGDRFLIKYITRYKKQFEARIINALENNSLNSFAVTEEEDNRKAEMKFAFDEVRSMSHKEFREMVDKILKQSKAESKINIINSRVWSLQDFMDILSSDCLFCDEYGLLFDTLGDVEIAVLSCQVFYEEFRDGLEDLYSIIRNKREYEAEWQGYFAEFIAELGNDRTKSIKALIAEIDHGEIML